MTVETTPLTPADRKTLPTVKVDLIRARDLDEGVTIALTTPDGVERPDTYVWHAPRTSQPRPEDYRWDAESPTRGWRHVYGVITSPAAALPLNPRETWNDETLPAEVPPYHVLLRLSDDHPPHPSSRRAQGSDRYLLVHELSLVSIQTMIPVDPS